MYMTRDRLEDIIDNILSWGVEHDKEFFDCLVASMDLTEDEREELGISDFEEEYEDEDDESDDEEEAEDRKRLKYLSEKEKCCPLDKDELYELQDLRDQYGE